MTTSSDFPCPHPWPVVPPDAQWHTIDSAPRDGTPFLARGGVHHGWPFPAKFDFPDPLLMAADYCWINLITGHRLPEHCLTHWMPLPPPPGAERPAPPQSTLERARALVARWEHGDEAHRQWLRDVAIPDLVAALTPAAPRRVRHKKRGTEYDVLGTAELQTATNLADGSEMIGQCYICSTHRCRSSIGGES